ncbi:MAG: hypothetical protein IPM53_10375 [Anaerolineaceae bacterium]|nr:hypothetical protein [Anaerolineaceae bacterium]
MFKKFKLHTLSLYLMLLVAALVLIGCGSGRSSEQTFEPSVDQSALVSAYAANQVPAESKMDYRYAAQNGLAANTSLVPASASDQVPAESKLDYQYAVQNGGLAVESPSVANENTMDFWYARQNGYVSSGN